jgi:CotH protein
MARSVFRRFYRARAFPSLLICLPGLLLVLWYTWSAFSRVDHYRRAVDEEGPLLLETLQIALHDQVETDIRRMLMGPPPDPSSLYTYRLRMKQQEWDKLVASAKQRKARPYVNGKVEHDGKLLDAEIRLRGNRHWHTDGAQKSLKVKLDKGELIHGHRIFNLINDPTSMVIGEQLILDLARESGVLSPRANFVRVKLNSKDLGVFHYETAADESLLRSAQRMPGSIYTSELPGSAKTDELWSKTEFWTKVSSRTDSDSDRADFSDLERFLHQVSHATFRAFYDFTRHELDLGSFARLDALDVAFGGDQRDFRENHNYYFDPYRGLWEPIAGEFRGFRDDPLFNLVDNPVLLRLKMTPGYLSLRDRVLYDFLTAEGSPSAIHARAARLLTELAPELRTDPNWDAYRQLPRVDAFHRRMLRPNTLSRLALVIESELTTYDHRHAQLVGALERNPLFISVGDTRSVSEPDLSGTNAAFSTRLGLIIDGHAGVALNELLVDFGAGCAAPQSELLAADVKVATAGQGGQLELTREMLLSPSIGIVPRTNPNERRGSVRGEVIPIEYELTLRSSCRPRGVLARGRHLATDSRVVSRPAPPELLARLPRQRLGAGDVPKFEAGEAAPHPWDLPTPEAEELSLGPGDVRIPETRVFEPHQTVTIRAGTRLLMGPEASLVFLGRVTFDGQRHQRIEIGPLTDVPWGGLAIQGAGTHGSRLSHVSIGGGTVPRFRAVAYPSMVDVHHTRDILIEGCVFGQNALDTDTLHAAYVDELDLHDTTFSKIPGDAVDLEYSNADVRRLRVVNAGDDALDLMGSRVTLADSMLLGAEGNGISAGEESQVNVQNTLIADCKVGVLAKNAAHVSLSGSVLFRNGTGVRSYQRTVRYAGESEVTANVLFVAQSSKDAVKRDDRKADALDRGRVLMDLPQPGVLDHVLQNVLEISDWQDLPRWIADQKEQAVR